MINVATCTASFGNGLSLAVASSQYVTVPSAVWFSGAFSVEAWVFIRSLGTWARLFDFGLGSANANVDLTINYGGASGKASMEIWNGGTFCGNVIFGNNALPLNSWTHVAGTFDGVSTFVAYINGVQVATSSSTCVESSGTRTSNYIGRSNWADAYADAIYDDFRIWNVARTATQILSA